MKIIYKKAALYTIISIYCMGVMVTVVAFLLNNYQTVRQEIIKHDQTNTTTLIFTQSAWNTFENKHEILHNNDYYDVISQQQINNNVIVKAIKDSTENHFRIVVNQVLNKHKKPVADKINKFNLLKHLPDTHQSIVCKTPTIVLSISHTFDKIFNQKTKNYIQVVENPPC